MQLNGNCLIVKIAVCFIYAMYMGIFSPQIEMIVKIFEIREIRV
jgi:hypothetical protein